jgi:hypothetical protein
VYRLSSKFHIITKLFCLEFLEHVLHSQMFVIVTLYYNVISFEGYIASRFPDW